jgi:hypothetical protein
MRKKGQEDHARGGGGEGRHIGKWRNRQIVLS